MITAELLRHAMPRAGTRADTFAPHLEAARKRWVGNNPDNVAHWLAQIAHESGELRFTTELWGPTPAQQRYEGRRDLGNTEPGDGYRFRGRGLIQLTGRYNYQKYSEAAQQDFVSDPDAVALPQWAADSAGWFWWANGLATVIGGDDPVLAVTKRVNGGTNGLADRRIYYTRAVDALSKLGQSGEQTTAPAPTPTAPKKEKPLIPAIIAALIPGLISALPELGRILKTEDKSERNIAIAQKALEVIAPAVNAANAQDAVERINADASAKEAARAAIAPMLEVIEVGGGIPAARKFAVEVTSVGPLATRVGWGLLISLLAIAIVIGGGWIMREVLLSSEFDSQTKNGILDYMKNVGLIVAGFAFGSSVGSRKKDPQ